MSLTGSFWDIFIVFGAGVMVSFTPCVYPVIPLTAGCIGRANLSGTKAHGFFLSLIFVFGLALTYCVLAVIASLTGRAFGMIQNQPLVYAIVALFLCLFGIIMLDILAFPQFHVKNADRVPRNPWTVFLLGAVSGLAVGPCMAPVLGTLLVYVASRERLLEGVVLTLVFSYGVGFSLILVGTFSGLLGAMPKSGRWMLWVKRISGAVILMAAGFFLFKALGLL